MILSPWQSFRLHVPREPAQVIRELAESIPRCSRWRTKSYFCGAVDVAAGRFVLYRSGVPRYRLLTPVMRGTLTPGDP